LPFSVFSLPQPTRPHIAQPQNGHRNVTFGGLPTVITDESALDEYNAPYLPHCCSGAISGGSVTKRSAFITTFTFALLLGCLPALAQNNSQPEQSTTFCTFEDGKEVSLRYFPVEANRKNDPTGGKPWTPGGSAILLFTPTDLTIGNTNIPTGA